MTRRNIGAFTDAGADYPAFISINIDDKNMVEVHVRSAKELGGQAMILLTRKQWSDLLNQSIGALNE